MTLDDIASLTQQYGEGWGHAHVCRVLRLIDLIGADLAYDSHLLTYAAYLHDWGAFPKFRIAGVDHALRSRQVAETEILPQTGLPPTSVAIILEAIEQHDYRNQTPVSSNEALLLREADWLDMLGVIGLVREFAWGPNNLQVCFERVISRRNGIVERLTLPRAQKMAAARTATMDCVLAALQAESFGHL
jgi:uncharacterized protein